MVHWVSESQCPFQIINEWGFQSSMKTERLDYYIPSPETVFHDVRKVFTHCWGRIVKLLQVCEKWKVRRNDNSMANQDYDGSLSFTTDAWRLPIHKAYVAVMIHFKEKGVPGSMLLNIVAVAKSHSWLNLTSTFATILQDFGISNKVSI